MTIIIAVRIVLSCGGRFAVRRGSVGILSLVPRLGSPFAVVGVVPFIVRFSTIGFGVGLIVGEILFVLLISSPGVVFIV